MSNRLWQRYTAGAQNVTRDLIATADSSLKQTGKYIYSLICACSTQHTRDVYTCINHEALIDILCAYTYLSVCCSCVMGLAKACNSVLFFEAPMCTEGDYRW